MPAAEAASPRSRGREHIPSRHRHMHASRAVRVARRSHERFCRQESHSANGWAPHVLRAPGVTCCGAAGAVRALLPLWRRVGGRCRAGLLGPGPANVSSDRRRSRYARWHLPDAIGRQERHAAQTRRQVASGHHQRHQADLQLAQGPRRHQVPAARLQGRQAAAQEDRPQEAVVEKQQGAADERDTHLEGPWQQHPRRRRLEQAFHVQDRDGRRKPQQDDNRLHRPRRDGSDHHQRERSHDRPDRALRHSRQRSGGELHHDRGLGQGR